MELEPDAQKEVFKINKKTVAYLLIVAGMIVWMDTYREGDEKGFNFKDVHHESWIIAFLMSGILLLVI